MVFHSGILLNAQHDANVVSIRIASKVNGNSIAEGAANFLQLPRFVQVVEVKRVGAARVCGNYPPIGAVVMNL